MILWFFALLQIQAHAQTPSPAAVPVDPAAPAAESVPATPAASASPAAKESSEYEVDYEEEPGAEEIETPVPEPVVVKKAGKKSKAKESQPQGSRAEKKITPMLKSETKSIYKKNGKALDVDTD